MHKIRSIVITQAGPLRPAIQKRRIKGDEPLPRGLIVALANALEISPGDLMRLPVPAPANGHTDSAVDEVRLTLMGVALGLVASFAVTRLVTSLLYSVSPTDVVTFTVVPLVLAVAALAASYLPALRATRIDPMTALRYD